MNGRMSYVVALTNYLVERSDDPSSVSMRRAAESFALGSLARLDFAFEPKPHPVDVLDRYIRTMGFPLDDDYEHKIAQLRAYADEEIAL